MVSLKFDRASLVTALTAGAAVAAGIMLVPAAAIEWRIAKTGLPAMFPAAGPPLGTTARVLLAATGGIGLAIVALIVLALISARLPRPAKAPRAADRDDYDDAAFDDVAPIRAQPILRPIFAGSDLGAPFDSIRAGVPPLDLGALAYKAEAPVAPEVEPEPVVLAPPEPVVEAPIAVEPEPLPAPEPIPAPAASAPRLWEPDPWFDELQDPEPVFAAAPPQSPPAPPLATLSLAELVQRLEAGMQRRRGTAGAARAQPDLMPMADMDSALREALSTLQRLTARSV